MFATMHINIYLEVFMCKILLTLSSIVFLTSSLFADYRCKATIIEHVPVVKIYFKEITGKEIDFKKGVPNEQIIRKEIYNPKLFDGSYESLDFEVNSSNGKGTVIYKKRVYTRNELEIAEKCYKKPNDKSCFYPVTNLSTGVLTPPAGMVTAKSEDLFFDGGASVLGSVLVVKDYEYLIVATSAFKDASFSKEEPDKDINSFEVEGFSKTLIPISESFETFVYGKSKLYGMHVSFEVACGKK